MAPIRIPCSCIKLKLSRISVYLMLHIHMTSHYDDTHKPNSYVSCIPDSRILGSCIEGPKSPTKLISCGLVTLNRNITKDGSRDEGSWKSICTSFLSRIGQTYDRRTWAWLKPRSGRGTRRASASSRAVQGVRQHPINSIGSRVSRNVLTSQSAVGNGFSVAMLVFKLGVISRR